MLKRFDKHLIQGRRQLREIGGGGIIKIREAKVFAEMRRLFLADQNQVISKKKKRSLPKSEGFFWPKSQIFRPKAGDFQKKKVFAEILRLFLAKIANSNVFSAQNHQLKKYCGEPRKKSGGHCPPAPPAGDAPDLILII